MSTMVAVIWVTAVVTGAVVGALGWWHGTTMYRIGRRHGWTRRELDMSMWSEDENV